MKPFDLSDLKAAAQGRWPAIHAALGIPQELLNTRKHQPCPNCGGRNRYRYTNHQESGGYICNQCGSGSGFDLIMLVFGYSFTESVNQVSALLGMARPSENRPAHRPRRRTESRTGQTARTGRPVRRRRPLGRQPRRPVPQRARPFRRPFHAMRRFALPSRPALLDTARRQA